MMTLLIARSMVFPAFLLGVFLLVGVTGCPASATRTAGATQFQAVMADSAVMDTDATPSPDGKWLAFQSDRGGTKDIWIRPIEGGEPRRLTRESDSSRAMTPTWAPDSKSLLFVSLRSKDYNVYSIPLEGGPEKPMSDWKASNRFASYSPDGKTIVFPSNRMQPGALWGFDLYLMDASGEKSEEKPARRLTNNAGSPGHPTWSPDGKWIAYVAKAIDTTKSVSVGPGMTAKKTAMFAHYHVFKVPVEGGKEVKLSGLTDEDDAAEEIWPSWSPDGKWIAVQRRVKDKSDVWLLEVSTGDFYRLTEFGDAGKPNWSPDGKSIWFTRYKGMDQDIWLATDLTPKKESLAAPKSAATKPASAKKGSR